MYIWHLNLSAEGELADIVVFSAWCHKMVFHFPVARLLLNLWYSLKLLVSQTHNTQNQQNAL
jgi:hypothetical protein